MSVIDKYTYEGPKMDLLEKARWIEGLLSGEFDQGRGALAKRAIGREGGKRTMRLCCLGVKCLTDGGTVGEEGTPLSSHPGQRHNFRAFVLNGPDGKPYFGIYSKGLPKTGTVTYPDGNTRPLDNFLAESNDKRHWSFKKIARWVDQNL